MNLLWPIENRCSCDRHVEPRVRRFARARRQCYSRLVRARTHFVWKADARAVSDEGQRIVASDACGRRQRFEIEVDPPRDCSDRRSQATATLRRRDSLLSRGSVSCRQMPLSADIHRWRWSSLTTRPAGRRRPALAHQRAVSTRRLTRFQPAGSRAAALAVDLAVGLMMAPRDPAYGRRRIRPAPRRVPKEENLHGVRFVIAFPSCLGSEKRHRQVEGVEKRLELRRDCLRSPSMTPERWQRVEELYHAAYATPAGERAAFLAEACREDEALRRQVESLLNESSHDGFLAPPRFEAVPVLASGTPAARVRHDRPIDRWVSPGRAARRGRHGRSVPFARREARARCRDQDSATRVHEASRSTRALRARSADARRR